MILGANGFWLRSILNPPTAKADRAENRIRRYEGEPAYSKTVRFYDINYQLAQNEDKNTIFESWCDFLNYFDPYHADPERRMRVHCGGFLRHRSPCACMGGRGAVGAGCFLERERYSDVAVNAHQDARYNPMSDGVHERKEWIY